MKIGLVSPYVYPLPGGVTQHVRFLYENLRLRGHEVRILTSSHGLQRSSEGDVIRLGKGFSMPANGSVGTITLSPRYVSQAHDLLERERFDVLHFHEPFVPFLSLVLLNQSQSVNIGTFHAYGGWSPAYEFGARAMRGYADRLHGRIAVSAAARHFIDRYFPGDYKVIPNGVDMTRFRSAVPADALAGRHPEHPVRGPVRAPQGRPGPAQGLPDPAQDRLRLPAAARGRRARRSARRAATWPRGACRASSSSAASRTTSGTSCSGPPTSSARRRRDGSRSGSSCSRRWRRARPSSPPTSTATRAWSGVAARRSSCRPRTTRSWPRALGRLLTDRELAASMSASGLVRAEEFSWPRVTAKVDDYYGFAIRRLAATGALPAHFTAPIPPSPRAVAGAG